MVAIKRNQEASCLWENHEPRTEWICGLYWECPVVQAVTLFQVAGGRKEIARSIVNEAIQWKFYASFSLVFHFFMFASDPSFDIGVGFQIDRVDESRLSVLSFQGGWVYIHTIHSKEANKKKQKEGQKFVESDPKWHVRNEIFFPHICLSGGFPIFLTSTSPLARNGCSAFPDSYHLNSSFSHKMFVEKVPSFLIGSRKSVWIGLTKDFKNRKCLFDFHSNAKGWERATMFGLPYTKRPRNRELFEGLGLLQNSHFLSQEEKCSQFRDLATTTNVQFQFQAILFLNQNEWAKNFCLAYLGIRLTQRVQQVLYVRYEVGGWVGVRLFYE